MVAQLAIQETPPTETAVRLSIRDLWKVFGPDPDSVLNSDLKDKPRSEVQEATGHVIALKNINIEVMGGEVFVVMGLSGSGKSTLVRCLLRLIEPSRGEILVDGEDIVKYDRRQLMQFRRRKAGMVFQRFGLMPHRTVLDNAAWGLEVLGVSKEVRHRRTTEVLELVGLEGWENSYPHELSGGMQQRVGLARALAADPEILLMDEPFSALDPLIRREMQDELVRLQQEMKKTVIFITHDLDEALKLGDRIAIMRDGEIIQIGTPEEIVMAPAEDYVSEFTRDVRRSEVLPVSSIMNPVKAKLYSWQGPRVALRQMRGAEEDLAFVVDLRERLLGMVTRHAAMRAAATGVRSVSGMIEEPPLTAKADAIVESLLPTILDYDHPIPVVDENNVLVGEVHRTGVQDVAFTTQEDEVGTTESASAT